jgi:hypothetical protein
LEWSTAAAARRSKGENGKPQDVSLFAPFNSCGFRREAAKQETFLSLNIPFFKTRGT